METTTTMQTITLRMPAVDMKFLNTLSKRMGWERVPTQKATRQHTTKKKTGLDEALDDLKCGRVSRAFSSVDELFESLDA